jgi:hypothetical protein
MEDSDGSTKATQGHSQDEYEIIWQNSICALIEPATSIIEAMNDGLEHAGLQLEIIPKPGTKNFFNWMPGVKRTEETDIEAEGETIEPGNPDFSRILEHRLTEFSMRRIEALSAWANSNGLSAAQFENLQASGELDLDEDSVDGHVRRDRKQLYLILYIQHMVSKKHITRHINLITLLKCNDVLKQLYTAGVAVLELSKFSDKIIVEGIMSKSRLIAPSPRRLWKWFLSVWDTSDAVLADGDRPGSSAENILLYSTSNKATRNIEHLLPRNAYERFGFHVRRFQDFLKGPELSFGFRSGW